MSKEKILPLNLLYDEIHIGDMYSFEQTIHDKDMEQFRMLSGDQNPLHYDDAFAKEKGFSGRIVYGMLLASLFSRLVGMYCPGEHSLYMSQTLQFKRPVFLGETVIVKGVVISKSDAIRVVTLRTEIFRGEEVVLEGEAKVKMV